MTNYRNQNACINCRFVRVAGNAPAPDRYYCQNWADVELGQSGIYARLWVESNGICDNYEHHDAEEQSKDEPILPNLPR